MKSDMKLVQARIVTHDVERAAAFFASLLGLDVALNEYYVEIPAGGPTVGFSKLHFTEWDQPGGPQVILDFEVDDVDDDYSRLGELGVEWVLRPANQPWGNRTMTLKSPEEVLVNVFSRRNP